MWRGLDAAEQKSEGFVGENVDKLKVQALRDGGPSQ